MSSSFLVTICLINVIQVNWHSHKWIKEAAQVRQHGELIRQDYTQRIAQMNAAHLDYFNTITLNPTDLTHSSVTF